MRAGHVRRTVPAVIVLAVIGTMLFLVPRPADAAPNGYVQMSDGTLIAINVRMPDGYVEGRRVPTIFEMSGYDGGSATGQTLIGDVADQAGYEGEELPLERDSRQLTEFFYANYATVHASVRGTGCSSGEFDLYSWRSALDGREVIEWIARQPWSNGKVGIMGHSYGGATGFMVAATQPPHLTAMTVSGLIDDLYRGIVYPGGVNNGGFPPLWAVGIRTVYDVGGGTAPGIVRTQDPVCIQNLATHRRTILNDPVLQGVIGDTDNDWWRSKALMTYAHLINVPIHIAGAYQDEQTGPRFPHVWEGIKGVPKRLLLTNGDHGTQQSPYVMADRVKWMDHWVRNVKGGFGTLSQDQTSVRTLLELHEGGPLGLTPSGIVDRRQFPLEGTRWTDYYLHAEGGLGTSAPAADEGSDSYFSGSPRQSWSYQAGPTAGSELTTASGPDELTFTSEPVTSPTAIIGPITATLFMSSTAPDTEMFVQLIDEGPDGSHTYLNRGLLKASHRAIDPGLSDYVQSGERTIMYRPYRPHTNPTLITPGEVYEYLVEVFPVGHVFRPGHRIVVKIHTPPAVDSFYAYAPRRIPGQNTVLHDAAHPSRIMLPVVALKGVDLGPELACRQQIQVRCIP